MAKRLAHTLKTLVNTANDKRGESLVEVLVAVTIGGLALIMLATAIAASSHMVMANRTSMESYYAANNAAASSASDKLGSGTVALASGSGAGSKAVALVKNDEVLRVDYRSVAEEGSTAIIIYDGASDSSGGGA